MEYMKTMQIPKDFVALVLDDVGKRNLSGHFNLLFFFSCFDLKSVLENVYAASFVCSVILRVTPGHCTMAAVPFVNIPNP